MQSSSSGSQMLSSPPMITYSYGPPLGGHLMVVHPVDHYMDCYSLIDHFLSLKFVFLPYSPKDYYIQRFDVVESQCY